MRAVILALLLGGCTTAMHFRVIEQGAYGTSAEGAGVVVASDAASYASLWARLIGRPSPPMIDFAKESVVFLTLGTRRTGGWSIEVLDVAADGTIKTKIHAPQADSIVTMALTAPYAVVAVDRHVKTVRWVDENGNLVAEAK